MMTTPRRVVFVCVENSNRSQIAEALARIYGGGRIEAFSAGSRPSGVINPKAIRAMQQRGYDLTSHRSKGLSELPDVEFDAAVTMGCGDACPHLRSRRRLEWNIPDPRHMPAEEFSQVCELIDVQVRKLVGELLAEVQDG
jgi:protein-tyrosine-phosphatase